MGPGVGPTGYASRVAEGRGVAGTAVVGVTVGSGVAVDVAVGTAAVASGDAVGGAVVAVGGTDVAVATGVAVGGIRDGVTWITPGVRVGTRVGAGVGVLVQPTIAPMTSRPRTTSSRAAGQYLLMERCRIGFLLHAIKVLRVYHTLRVSPTQARLPAVCEIAIVC